MTALMRDPANVYLNLILKSCTLTALQYAMHLMRVITKYMLATHGHAVHHLPTVYKLPNVHSLCLQAQYAVLQGINCVEI